LFGILMVPGDSFSMPRSKSSTSGSGSADAQELRALGRELAAQMQPGRLYLLGPGTSVAQVNRALNLPDSPLGVDAVLDGRLVATDASEAELLRLVGEHPQATVILGVVGGQGFLLGRGNQQLSPAVLAAVSAEHIEIIAARSKVAALDPPVLRIDLGDAQASAAISGYRRVRTGVARSTVLQVVA
jgi:predicted polyphosphate/ATP-dependent NAD kinase